MTKDEAVVWLMAWRDYHIPTYNLDFSIQLKYHITSGLESVWLNNLVDELIDRVRNGTEDPIDEVAMYYYEMNEIIDRSDIDHEITHRFAGFMEEYAHDILSYLKKKDKEMDEYERKKFLRHYACEGESSCACNLNGRRNRPDAVRNHSGR